MTATGWRVIGQSVRGAAHIRKGLPNQDAVTWLPGHGEGSELVVAVSDGHGSARCFRSQKGAELAAKAAQQVLRDLLASYGESLSATKRTLEDTVPQAIIRNWRELVDAHACAHPPTEDELAVLDEKERRRASDGFGRAPYLAYGATLLGALVTDNWTAYVQLGDGDIMTVGEDGTVERPIAPDPRLLGNETTSLCGDMAWLDVRVAFQARGSALPALVLLSTDGYANSFRDDSSFLQVGSDLLEMVRLRGLTEVSERLQPWLEEASQTSGDDVTMALLCRLDAFETSADKASPCDIKSSTTM